MDHMVVLAAPALAVVLVRLLTQPLHLKSAPGFPFVGTPWTQLRDGFSPKRPRLSFMPPPCAPFNSVRCAIPGRTTAHHPPLPDPVRRRLLQRFTVDPYQLSKSDSRTHEFP